MGTESNYTRYGYAVSDAWDAMKRLPGARQARWEDRSSRNYIRVVHESSLRRLWIFINKFQLSAES